MTVGERIRNRRLEIGMTQDELAKKLGYKSKSTINKIELGINDITLPKVKEFAKALEVNESILMGWEETNAVKIESIGEILKKILRNKKITLHQLSRKSNIKENILTQIIKSNLDVIYPEDLSKIAIALDIDITELLNTEVMDSFDFLECINIFEYMKYGEIKKSFDLLNDIGKKKALERIHELTYIPMYSKQEQTDHEPDKNTFTPDHLTVNAAHKRTDIELTPEGDAHDDAIMQDEDFWK